jgi:MYXO-CTERM domain-containing protein
MGIRGNHRLVFVLPLAAMACLWLEPGRVAAAPLRDPLDVHGLELADGRVMASPPAAVWGRSSGVDPRVREPGLVRLRDERGPVWVAWSDARRSASGIILAGVQAPGTVSSPARAEAFALAFIERHLAVLAPGSALGDFVVVGNDVSSGIRTVGLAQRHLGIPVLGGQLSLRFKADRLVLVASQALPDVAVPPRAAPTVAPALALARAEAMVRGPSHDLASAKLSVTGPDGTFVLPVWTGTDWVYHEVVRVTVDSREPLGRWAVYLDVETGEPIAREQLLRSVATVRFDVPERHPNAVRYDALAPELDVTQSGLPALTDIDGQVTLTMSPTMLGTFATGARVEVVNDVGNPASASFGVSDGGTVVWSAPDDEHLDAQLSAFVHVSRVKAHVRTLAPGLAWLDQPLEVNVNLAGSCNALSNGDQLYFLLADGSCQNTARLADVVYHEAGHSVHAQSIIPGVGAFDSALSEGISDYLACTIVDDSGMGRGFLYTDEPLRELDPDGSEWTWPQDVTGDPHQTGRIIAGTLWDLREALRAKLGVDAGTFHTDTLWYESIRRSVDIPSMYPEALAADDDDGDLANGTPNVCEINAAFEAHGLLDPSMLGDPTLDLVPVDDGRQVVLAQSLPMFPGCPLDYGEAELQWRLRGDPDGITTVPMVVAGGVWVATIPTQAAGVVVEYQVTLTYPSGAVASFPRNEADPWYQTYFGAVIPIYCLDDRANLGEWFFSGSGASWSFGPLMGGGIDPAVPYDADGVLLSQDGQYASYANTAATGPFIDIRGYQDVRLHYRRWLTVEDGFFDQATINVNGQALWSNQVSEQTNVHHIDREWRFHDLPLNDFLDEGQVQLQLALDSDGGLEFGGWTVDALCVVEVVESVCGDGMVTGDEECDDGNAEDGDGCDAACVAEEPDPTGTTGGDTEGDSGEMTTGQGSGALDDTTGHLTSGGETSGGATDDSSGGPEEEGSSGDGCGCAAGDEPGSWSWMGLLLLGAGGLRRRRSAANRVVWPGTFVPPSGGW